MIKEIFNTIVRAMNVVGPPLNYYPQISLMEKNKVIGSFSLSLCFMLLASNTIRIVYFTARPYDITLFLQCFVVIAMQFWLLHQAEITIQNSDTYSSPLSPLHNPSLAALKAGQVMRHYIAFVVVLFALHLIMPGSAPAEILCAIGAAIDAVIPLPQLIKNFRRKSVESLSLVMIFFWLSGDAINLIFLIINKQPPQFIAVKAATVSMELLIMAQFCIWGTSVPPGAQKENRYPQA